MTVTTKIAKEYVRRGAAVLRKHDPEWFSKVTLPIKENREVEGLGKQVGECPSRIIEDVFGSYSIGTDIMFTHHAIFSNSRLLHEHGFDVWVDNEDEMKIVAEWNKFIQYLQDQPKPD